MSGRGRLVPRARGSRQAEKADISRQSPGGGQGSQGQQHAGGEATRVRHETGAAHLVALELGKTVGETRQPIHSPVLAAVVFLVARSVIGAKISSHVDEAHLGIGLGKPWHQALGFIVGKGCKGDVNLGDPLLTLLLGHKDPGHRPL